MVTRGCRESSTRCQRERERERNVIYAFTTYKRSTVNIYRSGRVYTRVERAVQKKERHVYDRAFCHLFVRTFDKRWSNENISSLANDISANLFFSFFPFPFAKNDKTTRERFRSLDRRRIASIIIIIVIIDFIDEMKIKRRSQDGRF